MGDILTSDVMSYGVADAAIGVFFAVYAVVLVLSLAMYVMQAIAFMKMAKKVGVNNAWLAFIPIGDLYIMGRIADAGQEKHKHTRRLMGATIVFAILYAAMIAVAIASVVADPMADTLGMPYLIPIIILTLAILAVAICLIIFEFIVLYKMCDNFGGNNGVLYFIGVILGMFLMPIVTVILFLILSGKTPKVTDGAVVITPAVEVPHDSVF